MTAPPESSPVGAGSGTGAEPTGPEELLAALRASAGSLVEGTAAGSWEGSPDVTGLSHERGRAVLAAWTGARLHAGAPGLLVASDADVALLVGDWCYAHALQALAHDGDLTAIGVLATAIGACAAALSDASDGPAGGLVRLTAIWTGVSGKLSSR